MRFRRNRVIDTFLPALVFPVALSVLASFPYLYSLR